MTFTDKQIRESLRKLVGKRVPAWFKDEAEQSAWLQYVSKKIRTLLRHAAQARLKSPKADWVVGIVSEASEENDVAKPMSEEDPGDDISENSADTAEEEEEEEEAEAEKDSWFVGWDASMKQAWRATSMQGEKTYTSKFEAPTDCDPTDAALACWPDGFRHPIPELSVEMLTAMETDPRQKRCQKFMDSKSNDPKHTDPDQPKDSGCIYEGTNQNGNHVVLKVRSDKKLSDGSRVQLLALFEKLPNSKSPVQRCQLQISQLSKQSELQARETMRQVAEDFCTGKVDAVGIKAHRDRLLQAASGITTSTAASSAVAAQRPVRKRPAQQDTPPAPTTPMKKPASIKREKAESRENLSDDDDKFCWQMTPPETGLFDILG